jgi:hypothetical protein
MRSDEVTASITLIRPKEKRWIGGGATMETFLTLLILTGFSCLIAAYIHEGRHSQHKRLKGR